MKINDNMLTYKNFHGIYAYSEADKSYFGRLLGLTEPVTFKGKSKASLETAFFDAVDNYLFMHDETHIIPSSRYSA